MGTSVPPLADSSTELSFFADRNSLAGSPLPIRKSPRAFLGSREEPKGAFLSLFDAASAKRIGSVDV